MTVKLSLAERANKFWVGQNTSGRYGLVLLGQIIEHVRVNRDWDALSVFVARSGADKDNVLRVVKAAFGDRLGWDAARAKARGDAGQPAAAFKMMWAEGDVIHLGNGYGIVAQHLDECKRALENAAVGGSTGLRDVALQKALKSLFKPEKKDKENKEKIETGAKYVAKLAKDTGLTLNNLLNALQAEVDRLEKEKAVVNK